MVTAQPPGQSRATLAVPCPTGGCGLQAYARLPVPPVVARLMAPLQSPLQAMGITVGAGSIGSGEVMRMLTVVSQPLASAMVTS